MANAKVIEGLQIIVTDLAQQADGHALQSRIFAAQGFSKLAEKYAEHATEERGWVEKCTDRLLELGVDVKLEAKKEGPVFKNPVEWVKYDLEVSKQVLLGCMRSRKKQEMTTPPLISSRRIIRTRKRICTGARRSSS